MSIKREVIDEVRARTSLIQIVGQKVSWNASKSKPDEGSMWAPCPFHKESSASFHVDVQKGYYYCFGCHAKGDVFTFVREIENVEFVEAVHMLALKAGISVPKPKRTNDTSLEYITCVCSCGRTNKIPAGKLESVLGGRLTATDALSLVSKLRCSECQSEPQYLLDDKGEQIFGPAKQQS